MSTPPIHLGVDEQIESAQTLASHFYTNPAVLDAEKSRIFRRTWQLVGTLNTPCGEQDGAKRTIANPETFLTADVVGEPVVVVRDKQGTLRAFSNVCRHRAGPIAQGSGCKNVLRCGYHGWTYTLDGRLIGTPDIEGVEFFDRSTMGMVPLRCEIWEQLIFVNFDPNAEPLAAFLAKIPEHARGFQFAGLQFPASRLCDRLQLEGVRRQLSRGLPHSHRASRLDARNRLRAIPHRHLPLLLAAVRPDPRAKDG